jgi:phage gp29-like protein
VSFGERFRSAFDVLTGKANAVPTQEIWTPSLQDKFWIPVGTTFKPGTLVGYLSRAQSGYFDRLQAFYDDMLSRDAHLRAEIEKATMYVSGATLTVQPPAALRKTAAQKSPESVAAHEVAEYVDEQLRSPDVGIEDAIATLLGGRWRGIAGLQVLVEPGLGPKGREKLSSLTAVPSQRFGMDPKSLRLVLRPDAGSGEFVYLEDLGPSLVWLATDLEFTNPARRGLFRACMHPWLIRNEGLLWWANFVQLFGQPIRTGTYPPGDDDARKTLAGILDAMGASAWATIPKGSEINFVEATQRVSSNNSPHEMIFEWCAREMSKLIMGHTQTADVQRGAGSKQSAETGDDVSLRLAKAEAKLVARVLRNQLVKGLVERNFGPDATVPDVRLDVEKAKDLLEISETFKNFNDAGLMGEITSRDFHEITGLATAEDGEPMLPQAQKIVPPPLPGSPADRAPSRALPPAQQPGPDGGAGAAGGSVVPFPGSVRRSSPDVPVTAAPAVEPLLLRATAAAYGAGEEIVGPYRDLIDAAVAEGLTLNQILVRVLHRARADNPPPERLIGLLAAVQLDAELRGLFTAQKAKPNA